MIREIQKSCEVIVLDAYGVCKEYHEAMRRWGINNRVVLKNPRYSYIGGANLFARAGRILASGLEMKQLVGRLRQEIEDIQPDVVWTNSQKGFFFVSRAVGKSLPIIYYARGEGMYPAWYNRRRWHYIPLVIANSESGLSRIRNSPCEPLSMEVVRNGIDPEETARLASVTTSAVPGSTGLCLVLPGSLNENKNQGTAIRGLAKYVQDGGDACLWLCGDYVAGVLDEYARSLPVLADQLGISGRVHFLGWRDDMPAVIARSDIVVLASLSEGMPRVLLEAMSLRKPVIATRVGGIPEIIRDGVDGILIEPGDSEGFAAAVEKLADPTLRIKMGQSGFERANSDFHIRATATCFLDAVSRICC
jgi:glycosyltransferase involved in cell wall biosynthesis